jgi:subtilisin family serine protease
VWSSDLRSSASATLVDYGRTLGQLSRLNVPAMHDSGYIGTAVNVCVLDEGFNYYRKHEALRTLIVGGGRTRDFIRGVQSVQDTVDVPGIFEHGSWVLSALAGKAPGRYIGPAFGANFALGRTEYSLSEKPIEMVWWAMGAEWADSLGSDIISSSLGYNLFPDSAGTNLTYEMLDGHTSIVTRAAEIAAAKGILVVVSAGNDGNNAAVGRKVCAPADAHGDSVLAIGAVDSLGFRASFSSKGPTVDGRIKPDLAAQGVQVVVATADGSPNDYIRLNGTSFSAPLVAGMAACLMQARPSWPAVWIAEALKQTASQASSPDTLTGWGLPDGLATLRYVPDTLDVPDSPGTTLSFSNAGPNPVRTGTPAVFRLALGAEASERRYRLRVYDAGGRWLRDLAGGNLAPGATLHIRWHGDDANGRAVAPGLYFLDLESAGAHTTERVVVLR